MKNIRKNSVDLLNPFSRLDKYEREIAIFYLKGLFYDLSKIIIFYIFFSLFKVTNYFWYALLFLILFRSSSGGIHCKSYLGCLAVSLLVLSFSIILGSNYFIPKIPTNLITLLLGIVTIYFTPVISSSRPKPSATLIRQAKIRSLFCLVILLSLIYFAHNKIFTNIGFWSFVIHSFQLSLAHILRR